MDLEPTKAGFLQKSSIKQNQQHTTSVNNGKTTELSPKKVPATIAAAPVCVEVGVER
jgi:hypothetical protein